MIKHDALFKELIRTFFLDFVQLFVPNLAAEIDPDSIRFLDKELFQLLDDGERKEVDLLVEVKIRNTQLLFLFHIEVQGGLQHLFEKRMFIYFARLSERLDLPVYPIALFTFDRPITEVPNTYIVGFSDLEVMRFCFRKIQLNRLDWRQFAHLENPVAIALMSKMDIAPQDRPRVKMQCLRMIVTLRIDSAKMALITHFMDTYLRLSEKEELMMMQEIKATLEPQEQERIMVYTNSWLEKGISIGKQEGISIGKQEGISIALINACHKIIARKFGKEFAEQLYEQLTHLRQEQLELLNLDLMDMVVPDEVAAWLINERST